jgi:hypothetical protein
MPYGQTAALINGEKWRKVLRYGRSPNRKNEGENVGGGQEEIGGKKQQIVLIKAKGKIDKMEEGKEKESKKGKNEKEKEIGGKEANLAKMVEKCLENQPSQGHEEFGAQMDRLGARQFAPIAFRLLSNFPTFFFKKLLKIE